MKRTLYDIAEEYTLAIEELEEALNTDSLDGEIPEHIVERIEINKDEMGKKLRDYHFVINQLNDEVEALKQEIDRIKHMIYRKERLQEVLKDKIQFALETYGDVTKTKGRRFKNDYVNIVLVRKPKAIVINEEEIPDEYREVDISLKKLDIQTMSKVMLKLQEEFGIDPTQVKKTIKTLASKMEGDLKENKKIPGVMLDEDNCYIRFY